jgi:hypothetical protein
LPSTRAMIWNACSTWCSPHASVSESTCSADSMTQTDG